MRAMEIFEPALDTTAALDRANDGRLARPSSARRRRVVISLVPLAGTGPPWV
jgi:hypothetical protein